MLNQFAEPNQLFTADSENLCRAYDFLGKITHCILTFVMALLCGCILFSEAKLHASCRWAADQAGWIHWICWLGKIVEISSFSTEVLNRLAACPVFAGTSYFLASVSRVMCNHGMSDDPLRLVYKAVFRSKLLHASPAWWGFTSAADKQRLEASIWRAVRSGLYTADDPSFSQLVEDMDDNLFTSIRHNAHHVLYKLLPDKVDREYNLRPRFHSFSLTVKTDCKNYINRMLYKDIC